MGSFLFHRLADTDFCLPGQVIEEDSMRSLCKQPRMTHLSVPNYPSKLECCRNRDVRRSSVLEEVEDYAHLFTGNCQRKKGVGSANFFRALRTGVGDWQGESEVWMGKKMRRGMRCKWRERSREKRQRKKE